MNAFDTPESAAARPYATPPVAPNGSQQATSPQTIFRPARPSRAAESLTVTLENAERGVHLRVGDRFWLNLGGRTWQVRIGDDHMLRASDGNDGVSGGLGYYEALKPGKTKLFASSDPPSRENSPPGLMPTLYLEIKVSIAS